jgi:hypothetical protein
VNFHILPSEGRGYNMCMWTPSGNNMNYVILHRHFRAKLRNLFNKALNPKSPNGKGVRTG